MDRPCVSSRARPAARPPTATRSTPPWRGRRDGAEWIHLVDLDAAFGRGSNRELLADVVGRLDVQVELSGGIRDDASLEAALATGCTRVNLGTAALEDPDWCAPAIAEYGDQIAVGLDVRGTTLAARGWTQEGGDLCEVARAPRRATAAPATSSPTSPRTARSRGPNLDLLREVCARTDKPVVASGGVSSLDDLRALASLVRRASRAPSSARPSTPARSRCQKLSPRSPRSEQWQRRVVRA